jgi:tetratricopeptide (TPR) repeat protein
MGQTEDAINEFVQANALNPNDPLPDTYIGSIYLNQGEFGRAIQWFEQAADEDPSNPVRHGNLALAYYRNLQYPEAIERFSLAIHGGTLEDGTIVRGLPIDYDIVDFYYTYGFALSRSGRCGEAIPIFQAILSNIQPEFDENAVFNAEEGLRICEESAGAPAATTGTPAPTAVVSTATTTPEDDMGAE